MNTSPDTSNVIPFNHPARPLVLHRVPPPIDLYASLRPTEPQKREGWLLLAGLGCALFWMFVLWAVFL